jgi:F-type H+-transporting ATPase subunit a
MADPMLHIKDSYYFEIPKKWWKYTSLDQVPKWLRDETPQVTDIEQWSKSLNGKIIIPQPFGTPKNLYERGSGFCISKFMILELVACVILAAVFIRLAQRVRKGGIVRGGFWNMAEGFLVYLRDFVVKPAIGAHDADRYVPLLWTMFFFILLLNLFGLVPWAGSPTASMSVTLALAVITFLTVIVSGVRRFGPIGYLGNFAPPLDLPLLVRLPIQMMVLAIEVLGLVIRHGVLAVRLLANMVAGHLVLLAILGLIATAAVSASMAQWSVVTVIAVVGSALLSLLELFVAFLQAYVFTFLSALFIGMAIHQH